MIVSSYYRLAVTKRTWYRLRYHMIKNLLMIGVVVVLGVAAYLYWGNSEPRYETKTNSEVRLSFDYRTKPDGYVLLDLVFDAIPDMEDPGYMVGYQLMLQDEYAELQASTEPREGPPNIAVLVFENPRNLTASQWVDAYPVFSNISLARGEVNRDAVLAGANAVRYLSDGLYVNDMVVAASGGFIYMFVGSYLTEDSLIRRDFQPLLDSVQLQ
jgi:hypothetical protein